MNKLFEILMKRGYKQTSLAVQKENPAANFYLRLGYEIISEKSEEYLMVKKLEAETSELLNDLDKLHTTTLSTQRVKNNLGLDTYDVVAWCKEQTENADRIIRKGKNWYVYINKAIITINEYSFTIITAHPHTVNSR
jgi:hypothetical protein